MTPARRQELMQLAVEMESDLGLPDTYRGYFLGKLQQVERETLVRVKAEVQAYPALYCSVLSNHPEKLLIEWLDEQAEAVR